MWIEALQIPVASGSSSLIPKSWGYHLANLAVSELGLVDVVTISALGARWTTYPLLNLTPFRYGVGDLDTMFGLTLRSSIRPGPRIHRETGRILSELGLLAVARRSPRPSFPRAKSVVFGCEICMSRIKDLIL